MNKRNEFLYLKEEDMIKAGVLDINNCVKVIDETFRLVGEGDYLMGGPRGNEHGMMLWFPDTPKSKRMPVSGPDRRFMSLIAYLGGRFHVCGNKWYGSNIANREIGLPRSIHTITLNDPDTSNPLSIMSGNLVSAMRTGAVPGVATKYLSSTNAKVVGIVGTGVINRSSLLSIYDVNNEIEEVKIFDLNYERAQQFKKELSVHLKGVNIVITNSLEECVIDSDIINIATSGYNKPVIDDNWLKEGSLLILTGAAKLSENNFKSSTIVADNWKMHEAWLQDSKEHPKGIESIIDWAPTGDLLLLYNEGEISRDQIFDLGNIVIDDNDFKKNQKDRTIFVTGGLAVEDVAWAYEVYQNAIKNNIGQKLELWDKPHWS